MVGLGLLVLKITHQPNFRPGPSGASLRAALHMLVYEATSQVTDSSRYYRSRVKRVPDGLLNLLYNKGREE